MVVRQAVDLRYAKKPAIVVEPDGRLSLAGAALDRLTHHLHTLIIRSSSYRQRQHRKDDQATPSALPAESES